MKKLLASFVSIVSALALAACGKAFTGGSGVPVFSTMDGKMTLTLISKDELELSTIGRPTLLCKYSEQADSLRVVVTALGSQQVLYVKRIPSGLQGPKGEILLDAKSLTAAKKAEELALVAQLEKRRATEKQLLEEEQRLVSMWNAASSPNKIIDQLKLRKPDGPEIDIILSDVSIKYTRIQHGFANVSEDIWFGEIASITIEGEHMEISYKKRWEYGASPSIGYNLRDLGDQAVAITSKTQEAFKEWQVKWPGLSQVYQQLERIDNERPEEEKREAIEQASTLIIGTWQDENSVVEYFADGRGSCKSEDGTIEPYAWSVKDGFIHFPGERSCEIKRRVLALIKREKAEIFQ